jgi:hypothetical protein
LVDLESIPELNSCQRGERGKGYEAIIAKASLPTKISQTPAQHKFNPEM